MKDKFLRHLKFEKRVSENTIKSYDNDLSQFLTFSEKYENNRKLSSIDRPIIGQKANMIKMNIQELITERKGQLANEALDQKIKNEKIDVTIPSNGTIRGSKHPLISTQDEIIDIFCGLGSVSYTHLTLPTIYSV